MEAAIRLEALAKYYGKSRGVVGLDLVGAALAPIAERRLTELR